MTAVLVTGGTGSLGSALARRLIEEGHTVSVLVPPGEGLGGLVGYTGQFKMVSGDVTVPASLPAAVRGVEEVFHLAGEPTLLNRLAPRMRQVNVVGAREMATAAARAGVRRLVHTSSVSAIGYPPPGEVADETFDYARTVTRNAYSDTKRAGEQAVLEVGAASGMEVVVVNPSGVLAPHSSLRFGWAALVASARAGRLVAWFPGGVAVCAARELVAGQLAAMARGRPGQRYILSTANLSYQALFRLVCEVVGAPPPRFGLPAGLVRAAAWACAGYARLRSDPLDSPLLVPENAALAVRSLFYAAGKSRDELGVPAGDLIESVREIDAWLGEVHTGAWVYG